MYEELTKTEKEICNAILAVEGSTRPETLAIVVQKTKSTVKTHLRHIFGKLCVVSSSELVYLLLTKPELLEN